ncbi:MAG: pyridoxamine 5'-phosphate oxidase family protein [Candidatus Omnitrophica bacterium COP1]|nr:pyridoxamine 5'-phosphate oxidase family protein [Candidatus Omnitrophica bacterium COP1]
MISKTGKEASNMIIQQAGKEVIERSEWVAIATSGPDGPHLVATWGDYVRALGIESDRLFIPAGNYRQTEEILKGNDRIELLFASRQVKGEFGQGRGCHIRGRGEMKTSGPELDQVKTHYPWARGVLIVHIEMVRMQL